MDHLPPRSMRSMIKQTQVHRKGRSKLANLREAVNPQTVEVVQSSTKFTDSNSKRLQRENINEMERQIWSQSDSRRLNPDWRSYVSKPILPRGSYGLSNRVDRTKSLGNSVVPASAAIPLKRVLDLYHQ